MKHLFAALAALTFLFTTGFAGSGSGSAVQHAVSWGEDVAQYPGRLQRVEIYYEDTSQLDLTLKWFNLVPGAPYIIDWALDWDVSVDGVWPDVDEDGEPITVVQELAQHDVFHDGSLSGRHWVPSPAGGIDFSYPVPVGGPLVITSQEQLARFQGRSVVDLEWSVGTSGWLRTIFGESGPVGYEYNATSYTLIVKYFPLEPTPAP